MLVAAGVPQRLSVVIPYSPSSAGAAASFARALDGSAQVVLAGEGQPDLAETAGRVVLRGLGDKGAAIRAALPLLRGDITVLQDPDPAYSTGGYAGLTAPIASDEADAVFGTRSASALAFPDRALSRVSRLLT
ncbi:MAG: glycosyltransferase family protein, partial [Myxococcaceae bacterium]